ncbi:hypothetical protein EAS64_37830 [Trebonia kvetii]|uniref:Aquaporin family protein n=1 Tax=Trebonia kvetii TaxID=2480626 RepID=A0A6P2BQC4_9ACTN|nr:hypothetical protein [Trebonia kvetii]TVZ00396.1 hypothetical protein EAS64_37830 [Trebonia kvetii]
MANDAGHAESLGRRYLIQFDEDTLRQRRLRIRLAIEFLGTFILVTVAGRSGHDEPLHGRQPDQPDGGGDRARGGRHGHDLRLGPLSGLHINPAVTFAFTACGMFPHIGHHPGRRISARGRRKASWSVRRARAASGWPDANAGMRRQRPGWPPASVRNM